MGYFGKSASDKRLKEIEEEAGGMLSAGAEKVSNSEKDELAAKTAECVAKKGEGYVWDESLEMCSYQSSSP